MDDNKNGFNTGFSDLDAEISRLKAELAQQGDMVNQIRVPASTGDFWGRRMEEEKKMYEKKMQISEEEKRVLEARMNQQQEQITKYHGALSDLEKRFEREAKAWEERLKAKEADLLLEKNRIFWEEKLRETEHENHSLLQQVSHLNDTITQLKDEQAADKLKYETASAEDKQLNETKIAGMQKDMEALRNRAIDLQAQVAAATDQLRSAREDLTAVNREMERKVNGLISEKTALGEKMNVVLKQAEDEKAKIELWVRNVNTGFVQKLRHYIGSLEGLAHFISERPPSKATTSYLEGIIQELEGETEMHATSLKLESYQRTFTAVDLLVNDEAAMCRKILSVTVSETKMAKPNNLIAVVEKSKPQVLLISGVYYKKALVAVRRWPFLPIIIFGAFNQEISRKLTSANIKIIAPPFMSGDIADIISSVARHSIARPDYWERINSKRGYFGMLLTAGVLSLGLLMGYYFKDITGGLGALVYTARPATYIPPYTNPSNIAFDGKNMWVCDWFGQSIYKHSADSRFKVEHIYFYPGKHFTAVTWHNGSMWTADAWDNKVYRHNNDDELSIAETFTVPELAITGLASDGKALYSCDTARGQIYRHRMDATLSVDMVYDTPGKNPCGLFFDGKNLWSIDSKTDRIYRHRMDAKLTPEASYLIPELSQKPGMISGIAIDNDVLWLTSEKFGKVMSYPLKLAKK